jgi:hypothetical protein
MITLSQFKSLEKRMDYEEVCAILSGAGELIPSESAQIEPGIQVLAVVTDLVVMTCNGGELGIMVSKRKIGRLNKWI